MKIDSVTCRVVDFPLEREFHPAWARGRNQSNIVMVLSEVRTDDGITGVEGVFAPTLMAFDNVSTACAPKVWVVEEASAM